MTAGSGDEARVVPLAERHRHLAEVVTAEVRAVLELPPDAALPGTAAFFDVGMTSLRLSELRQRLVRRLGRRIDLEELFDHATPDRLIDHLGGAPEENPVAGPGAPAQLDDVLRQLYG